LYINQSKQQVSEIIIFNTVRIYQYSPPGGGGFGTRTPPSARIYNNHEYCNSTNIKENTKILYRHLRSGREKLIEEKNPKILISKKNLGPDHINETSVLKQNLSNFLVAPPAS
jgi:hypothetical protein